METKKEAWLIRAVHMGDYDCDTLFYALHGEFLEELKERVHLLRQRAVSVANDVADGAYNFGLVSSIYPDLDGFITPADCDDVAVLFPHEDPYDGEPLPAGEQLQGVLAVSQKDVWRFSGGSTTLYVSGTRRGWAKLDVTSRCGTMFHISLPDEWFDELRQNQ